MRVGSVTLGTGPCKVIVDLGNAHNQDLDRCLRLMDAAKIAGADLQKLQLYTPDELIALRGDGPAPAPWNAMSMRELYAKAQTPAKWVKTLFRYAFKNGITLFSSVFGAESLAVLQEHGCPAFKLAALDYGKPELLDLVIQTGKPVLMSCPTANAPPYAALYCPPGYPQTDLRLNN